MTEYYTKGNVTMSNLSLSNLRCRGEMIFLAATEQLFPGQDTPIKSLNPQEKKNKKYNKCCGKP